MVAQERLNRELALAVEVQQSPWLPTSSRPATGDFGNCGLLRTGAGRGWRLTTTSLRDDDRTTGKSRVADVSGKGLPGGSFDVDCAGDSAQPRHAEQQPQ